MTGHILNIITESCCKILSSASHFFYILNKNDTASLEFYFLDIFFPTQFLLPLFVGVVLGCSLDALHVDNTPRGCKLLQLPTRDSGTMGIWLVKVDSFSPINKFFFLACFRWWSDQKEERMWRWARWEGGKRRDEDYLMFVDLLIVTKLTITKSS